MPPRVARMGMVEQSADHWPSAALTRWRTEERDLGTAAAVTAQASRSRPSSVRYRTRTRLAPVWRPSAPFRAGVNDWGWDRVASVFLEPSLHGTVWSRAGSWKDSCKGGKPWLSGRNVSRVRQELARVKFGNPDGLSSRYPGVTRTRRAAGASTATH